MSQRATKSGDAASARDEEIRQYTTGGQSLEDLDKEFPARPKNHARTFLFSELFQNLFDPLNDNKKQPSGPSAPCVKRGPHGRSKLSPHEQRRSIVERFISRWRSEVGNDFYPALRLIIPNQDRDRGVYGLKENAIAKLLVKVMGIPQNSEDAQSLLRWKLPGQSAASRMAGDFAGRCYESLSKREVSKGGIMRIADVNEMLDKLAAASGECEQFPIIDTFYQKMNARELMWLIRVILKYMKVGATENTFFDLWHPDAEALFSISSSLRRVCWELSNPSFRIEPEDANVQLNHCFQPQLASFQVSASFSKMVDKLLRSSQMDGETEYWIEEKLDGERMQMHMSVNENKLGGKEFCFWSRKAKDYTYLYGSDFEDDKSALTRHLKEAFAPGVRNIILDGEMITWDMELDKIMQFGTLKTAALSGQKNPFSETGARPIFRVFDILYLNGHPLTGYSLRVRREALRKAVPGVFRRLEIHSYHKATSPNEIEPQLRKVVEIASEGLVLKNPLSVYRLGSRNDDWMKIKPEYMDDLGESVDCVIIGGYYGSGRRGGRLSSFLCGFRADENHIQSGHNPEKCWSFCKVGGGIRAEDYAEIRHHTEGKWHDWDPKNPPDEYIELGGRLPGKYHQYEKPDLWIRPSQSVVMSLKAASVGTSDQFARNITLRFPRFRALRLDKRWNDALTYDEFLSLRKRLEEKANEKESMKMETRRRPAKRMKKEVIIVGQESAPAEIAGPKTKVFEGLEFCVLTDSATHKKSKPQIEALIKQNGGKISQTAVPDSTMLLIGERNVVKVASLLKRGNAVIIKPNWVFDCLAQSENPIPLPFEPGHLFRTSDAMKDLAAENVDQFGDPYARELDLAELRNLLKEMPKTEVVDKPFNKEQFLSTLEERGHDLVSNLRGHLFSRHNVYFAVGRNVSQLSALQFQNWVKFGGGKLTEDLEDITITNIVILSEDNSVERELAAEIRSVIGSRWPIPNITSQKWLEDCWKNNTLVDEERYKPM